MLEIYCPYCNSKVNVDKKSIEKNKFLKCSSCSKIFKIKIEQQTMIDCPNCRYAFEIDNLDFKNGDLVECAACNKEFYIDKSYEYLKEIVKTSKLTFWQKIRSLFVKDMFSDCSVDRIKEKPNEENLVVDLPVKKERKTMSDLKDAYDLAVNRYRRDKPINYTNNIDEPIKLNFENPKEDRSVLNAIDIFKIINWIVFSIGAAISVRVIVCMRENEIIVEAFAFQILVSLFIHWIVHIFFCWSRGIYRNVAWIASSTHLKENNR